MLFRLPSLVLITGLVIAAIDRDRVFGFAALTTVLTFCLYFPLEMRRFRVERPFFLGRTARALNAWFASVIVIVSAAGRAMIVGAAAIFTFPSPDMFAVFDTGYADQLKVDAHYTFLLFGGVTLAAILMSFLFDFTTQGRGHRWCLFRMAAILGVLFSAGAFFIQQATHDSEHPVFVSPKGDVVLIALREAAQVGIIPCESLAEPDPESLDGVVRPNQRKLVERGVWRANGCGARLTPKFCDSLKKPDGTFAPLSFNRSIWKDHGCEGKVVSVSLPQLISVVTVLDDFVDQAVVSAAKGLMINDDSPLSRLIAALLAIFVSSNLLQGIVISTYATLILTLTRARRMQDIAEDVEDFAFDQRHGDIDETPG